MNEDEITIHQHPIDILVVDDDQDTREAVREVLVAEGHSVRCAYDGYEAIALIEDRRPGLVILDLMMPRMNGWELLSHLEQQPSTSRPPIIVFTADRRSSKIATSTGVTAFLTKPVDLDRLIKTIESATTQPTAAPQPSVRAIS